MFRVQSLDLSEQSRASLGSTGTLTVKLSHHSTRPCLKMCWSLLQQLQILEGLTTIYGCNVQVSTYLWPCDVFLTFMYLWKKKKITQTGRLLLKTVNTEAPNVLQSELLNHEYFSVLLILAAATINNWLQKVNYQTKLDHFNSLILIFYCFSQANTIHVCWLQLIIHLWHL